MTPAIELIGIDKRFGSVHANKDVSLAIEPGSIHGIIGENGAGKSTLLKLLTGITRPTAGELQVNGRVASLLELGAGFHPELSGRDNVYLNGSILGLSKKEIDRRYDDIVSFAFGDSGQEDRIDTPVKNYSSGMYVKLGFSVAINVDPDLLLVDEVLTVGDEAFQRKCADKFLELKDSGKTVVIVSHALGMVRDLCDEAALLDHGHLTSIGHPEEVIDAYMQNVETNVRRDGEHGTRWGEGGARIMSVEVLNAGFQEAERLHIGQGAVFRIHYDCDHPIKRPVFKLEIHTPNGTTIAAGNTRFHDRVPDQIQGHGAIEYRIPKILLVPGLYDLSVTLFDYDMLHPFDSRHRFKRFEVGGGFPPDVDGVVSLDGEFAGAALPPQLWVKP